MAVITSLAMVAGVQSHVTIGNANAGHAPLSNAGISWAISDFSGTGLNVLADAAGGFFFNASSPGNSEATATYQNGAVTIHMMPLPVTVTAAVLPEYLSP